jgi:asparagine synthase (glutamine-hydrolysing)
MIAAVLDSRGVAHAEERLKHLFSVARRQPRVIVRRGLCALGSTEGPLDHAVQADGGLVAFAQGALGDVPVRWTSSAILRGACALLAADEQGLMLARGPFGGRPLYYSERGSRSGADSVVVACTELQPIERTLQPIPELNPERLAALVSSVTGDPNDTVYKGILRLSSCEVIRFTQLGRGSATQLPTWPDVRSGSVEQSASALREHIMSAVDRCVSPFRKVAVIAGGGLDSSGLVAALALRAERVPGFKADVWAIDFAGPGDDRPHLDALVRHHRLEPHRLRPAEAAPFVPACFVSDGAPLVWGSGPTFVLAACRARGRGAEAILSGWGGDWLFDGDLDQFAHMARGGQWIGAVLGAARLELLTRSSALDRIGDLVARPLVRDALPDSWRAFRNRIRARLSSEWAWAGPVLRSAMIRPRRQIAEWRAELAAGTEMDEAADERGQQEVAFGIPRLDPYLDANLIDLVASIPPDMLLHGHRMRGLFREAMRGILPESLRLRSNKASFEPAIDEMFESVARKPEVVDLLKMEALADLGIVEPRPYKEALRRTIEGRSRRGWLETWPALAVEAFVQQRSGRTRSAIASSQPHDLLA